jgi:hypothetical protein
MSDQVRQPPQDGQQPDEQKPDYGKPYEYEPDFSGPPKQRKFTDLICLGLFAVCILGWICVGIYAFTAGDARRVACNLSFYKH